jgi:20S proteasome subunit beta 3
VIVDYVSDCLYLHLQEPEDLFETISQAMLNAVDRDAVSGMGVVVQVM